MEVFGVFELGGVHLVFGFWGGKEKALEYVSTITSKNIKHTKEWKKEIKN